MSLTPLQPYVQIIRLCILLAALALASLAGWHARAVVAERDALRTLVEASRAADVAQRAANAAALRYIDQRDRLEPRLAVVWRDAAPIVRVLDGCPLPVAARGLLDVAADAADCRAGDCAALSGGAAPGGGRSAAPDGG